LLSHGADASYRSPEGKTALSLARKYGYRAIANTILTHLRKAPASRSDHKTRADAAPPPRS